MQEGIKLSDCLDEAKATICGERQDVYGSPEDSFAIIAQYWNIYLIEVQKALLIKRGFDLADYALEPLLSAKDIAHMMILFKMARVQGQAPKRDNYVDICGYSSIAADKFTEAAKGKKSRGQILLEQDQRIKAQAQQSEQMKFFNDLLSQLSCYGTAITGTDGKTLEQRVVEWERWAEFEGTTEFPMSEAAREQDIRDWACGTAYSEADEGIELDEEDMGVGKFDNEPDGMNYGTIKYGCCSDCKLKFNRGAL